LVSFRSQQPSYRSVELDKRGRISCGNPFEFGLQRENHREER
jgi:hypothetical protein